MTLITAADASPLDASHSNDQGATSSERTEAGAWSTTTLDASSPSNIESATFTGVDSTNNDASTQNTDAATSEATLGSQATSPTPSADTLGSTSSHDGSSPLPSANDAGTIVLDAGPPDAGFDAANESAVDGASDVNAGDADAKPDDADATTTPTLNCEVTTVLTGVVRDFEEDHPDMEPCDDEGVDCSSERGLVAPLLGDDDKPVFVSAARDDDSTIQSEETFDQWFRDVEGVNVAIPFDLRLTTRPRMLVFDSDNPPAGSPSGFSVDPPGFFPIDDWNESERPHNYHFTYEVTAFIEFQAGDSLTIRGDDDIFVFINRRLVVDLGGIHLPQEGTVEFDDIAAELDLQPNTAYEFKLFFAERHVEQSNLRLSTNGQFLNCTVE